MKHPWIPQSMMALGMFLAASCSGPNMTVLDRPVGETRTTRSLTEATALESENRRTLRKEDLLWAYDRDPEEAIRILRQRQLAEATDARRRALAEMSSDTADRLTKDRPSKAMSHYLEAAYLTRDSLGESDDPSVDLNDQTLHLYATVRAVRVLHANPNLKGQTLEIPNVTRRYHLELARGREFVPPSQFDQLVPASLLKFKGMNFDHVVQEGIGEAMVGHRNATEEARAADPAMPSYGHSSALNATLQFSGSTATIALQNLTTKGHTEQNGKTVALKGDYTAPLAFLYNDRRAQGNKYLATLRPWTYRHVTRLDSLEPFREDKIPLVVVHGLMSTGGSFFKLANALRADPVMRERYQLMLFTYPSGNPIGQTGADLREALTAYYDFYDPNGKHPALGKTVIIGHSMGGLVSNIQVRSSGNEIEKLLLKQNLENFDADEASKQRMEKLIRFEANPNIQRVVFIAAPHRGSTMASATLGQIGSWLIKLPFDMIEEVFDAVVQQEGLTEIGQALSSAPRNGIAALRPDNPILPTILELPVRDGVVIHSIIAQKDPDQPLAESSDGVVPYSSSHLDEAATEIIVPNQDHKNVVNDPRCVEEILRILHEHADPTGNR